MADVTFDDLPAKPSPNQYDPLFEKHGRAYGVDPLLLKAQARVESGLNPQAQSGVGAQGLMQLMPINQRRFGVTNPFDPDQNIRGAAALQQENMKRAEGDPAMALAYYHGGPDIAQHGPKTLAYRDRVLSEYERLKPKPQDVTFDDLPPAKEEGTGGRGFLGVAKDIGIGLGQGVIQFPGTLYSLGNAVTGGALDRGTKAASAAIEGGEGESFSAKVNRSQQILADIVGQSKELTAKQQELNRITNDPEAAVGDSEFGKAFNAFATGFGYVLLNPDLAVNLFAQSVPSMVGMAGATRKATEMALARNATPQTVQRMGEYANVLVNGVMEGGDSAGQTKQAIMGMSFADLQAGSADYRQLRASGKSPEQAREEVADKASRVAAILGGVIGGGASKLTGAASFEAKVFGKGTGKIAKGAAGLAGNVARETAEEGLQNAGDQFAQNVGTKLHANAAQNLAEGVAAQAGPGAAIGALTGGAFHGVGMLGGKTTPEQTPPPPPPSLQFGDKKVTSTPELQAHLATVKPEERHAALVKALGLNPEDEGHAALKNVLDLVHPDQHAQAIGAKFFGDAEMPLPHTPVTDTNFEATVEAGIKKLHAARAEIVANHPEGEALSREQEKQLHVLDQRILALQDQGTKSLLADAKKIFEAAKNTPSIFTTIRDAANEMPAHTKPTVEKLVTDLEADPKSIFAQATQTPDIVRTIAKAVEGSFSIKENKQHGQEANNTAAVASDEGRNGRNRASPGGQEKEVAGGARQAISAVGIHYSQAPRQTLDSHHYGTGMKGAEAARVQQATDARLKKRLYFYVNTGEGIKQEKYVGSHAHRAPLTNLYDLEADHLNLYRGDDNAFESAVLDHGYDGYVTRTHHAAVLLGSHHVKAEHLGLNADVSKTPIVAEAQYSEDKLVAKALIASKALPHGEIIGKDWVQRIKTLTPEIAARLDKLGVTDWLKGQDSTMHKSDIVRLFKADQSAPSLKLSESKTKHPAFKHLTDEEIAAMRNDVADKFVKMYGELASVHERAAVAFAGRAKKGWYARSVQAIIDAYGVDAPRFAALLASMSPQTDVKTNFEMAVEVWKAWTKAGRPTSTDAILKVMRAGIKNSGRSNGVLGAWFNNTVRTFKSSDQGSLTISGPKVNSFMRNLQGDVNEVTNDGWMAAFDNVNKKLFGGRLNKAGTSPGKTPLYLAANAKNRAAAEYLTKYTGQTWTPAEVQETIWSWSKTLYELQERAGEKRGARQLLADGELTDQLIASTPDFGRMFASHDKFKVILDKAGADRADQENTDQRPGARGEAAPFAGEAQARHERRAAGRLEQLREQRLADEANKRIREETGGSFSRKSNAVTVEEARGTGTDAAIDDLTRIVKNFLGKEAPAGPLFERAAAGKTEAHLSQAIAKVFGQQVVFFRNVDPDSFFFDGMAAKPEHGGRIYLNVSAESPFLNTTGHEFLHKLRNENPALYKELSKEIWKHLDEHGASKHMAQIRKMYSDLKLSEDKVREEVVADVAGDVMATKEFWQDISKREPSLFRTLADIIIKFLNSAAEKLRGTFGTEKFVKDIDAVRSAVVGAYVEWARQSQQYKDAIKRPSFDEWFGDSVTKDKNGPQVFYHGTARDFKQFKPKQAGAIFFTKSPRFAEDFSANSMLWVADQISTHQMLEKYGPKDALLDKQEFQNYMQSAPAIYPVFLKAEAPFDWENHDHVGQLDSWLDSEYAPNLGEAGNAEFMKDQREAKGSAVTYKNPRALLNAVADGDWTAIEHPIVQKFIRSQGFDSFYTQEAMLKNIAVLHPDQVKSIFSTNFETSPDFSIKPGSLVNDLFSKAGQQYVGSTPRQRKLYIKAGERALDQINKWIGNRMSPLGALPNEGLYTVQRSVMMGLIAKADEAAGKIGDIFNKATAADRKAVYEYWTTAFGKNTAIVDPEVRQTAIDVKKRIEDIGDLLAKRGLVDAKDIAANRGKYVPRLYLKHLLNEADWRAVGAGKSLSDLGYTKKRKDIPEHIRLALLGEIREPGFLGAMAIGKPLRDIAILDFLDTMSKNKDWAWDGSVTTYNGQRVSVPWLKNEATRLEEQAAYYDDPALKKAALDEAEAMRKVYLPLEAKAGKVSDDYAQIPDTPRYGLLRGMWVRKEIKEDLIGSAHLNTNGTGWAENFFGYGGIGTKLTQAWKTSKVALNPPGQVRNFISNMILLHLSGVPMHMIPMRLGQAVQAIRTKNKYWDIAQKYGITEGTFGAQELYRLERELLEDKGEGGPFAFLRHAKKIASFAGDVYQKMEEIGKIAKIIDEMEAGSDETHAVLQAQRWLFDYSLVPKSVRFLRNNPIGIPFMTFYYKLAPRLLEVALTAPHRFVPYIGAAYLLPMLVAGMVGATPDDLEKLKKALPEWLRDKQHVYVLPERDSTGRWQFLDLSYLMPWTMFTDAARQVKDGKFADLMSTTGLFTGPVIDLVQAIRTNIDPFTKREIANKGDPVNLQVGAWLTWLYNEAMPPVITNRGLIGPDLGDPNYNFGGKLHQNLFATTNKFGEAKQTNAQTVSSAFGVNVYPINPRTSRISEMQKMEAQMMDAERLLVQKLGDKGLSPEARQNTIDTYRAEMRKRVDAIKKYATESQVPANLQ